MDKDCVLEEIRRTAEGYGGNTVCLCYNNSLDEHLSYTLEGGLPVYDTQKR